MTIIKATVNRRPSVPTHGWSANGFATAVVPSLENLVYDIYDTHREIIGSIKPKRTICRVPVPVKFIERVYAVNPQNVRFDGMLHEDAITHYWARAEQVGVRNSMSIPFIFANEIIVTCDAFGQGIAYRFVNEEGFRWMVMSTQQEFFWLSSKRQILNNLSFRLNMKYNCNLHIAADEAQRVFESTGQMVAHNRHLYTTACSYYLNPKYMDLITFLRCQIPVLRKANNQVIEGLLQQDPTSMDATLAYELKYALAIYNGEIDNFLGDYSDEPVPSIIG